MNKHIIFDLDGTLIDSSSGILAALGDAFNTRGLSLWHPLTPGIIGPPLMETLAILAGTNEPTVLLPLTEAFKNNYDEDGYRKTTVFPGVTEMLTKLHQRGYNLHIATNKRIYPTQRIISFLGWEGYFLGVYALDSFEPPLKSKTDMLSAILARHEIDPRTVFYIGDRQEDGEAALDNRIAFLLASWGFGEPNSGAWEKLLSPGRLIERVARE